MLQGIGLGIGGNEMSSDDKADPSSTPALSAHKLSAPSIGPALGPYGPAALGPYAPSTLSESHYHGAQGMYLAASGTLTQFNAIMAALLTAALSVGNSPAAKIVIGLALVSHAVAGFLLCWAARPIANADGSPRMSAESLLLRSLLCYRRGWRATMLALAMSGAALVVLVSERLGVPDLLSPLS
jgi:hypothetical protein